jgi:capsular exopolysaccharide synthesis family protein
MNAHEPAPSIDAFRAVRRRWRVVLFLTLLVTAVALGLSFTSVKKYDATVDLLLRDEQPANALLDPGGSVGTTDPARDLKTNVDLIKVDSTAATVRRELGLRRPSQALLDQLNTKTDTDSNVVSLIARDPDPVLAAKIANAFAQAYVQFRRNSARRRYTDAARLAESQLRSLSPTERTSTEAQDLRSRQRELQIAAALQTGGVEIVRPATRPVSAATPRPVLNGVLGVFVGLLLGVFAALALELVDRRLKDEEAVEEFFDLPVVAGIPQPSRRGRAQREGVEAEAYGLLAANLRLSLPHGGDPMAHATGGGVLLVTSPSPGDGKTSVTFGIARACARLGLRVIVIEADLRRPAFSRYLDVNRSRGLTAVIAGFGTLEDELVWLDGDRALPTVDERQRYSLIGALPAGELPITPQRALAQDAMRNVVEQARSLADVVLIDTAPVGTVNDATTLMSLVDAVVLVTRLNQTTKDAARRALRVLRNLPVEIAGVVVTGAGASERYGYYPAGSGVTRDPEEPVITIEEQRY